MDIVLRRRIVPPACLIVLLAFAIGPASGAEELIACPAPELPAAAVRIVTPPSGWTPYTATFFRLESASISYGPPETQMDAVPFSSVENARGRVDTYPLDLSSPTGNWLNCSYGAREELTLARRLEGRFKICVVTYTHIRKKLPLKVEVRCKTEL
ncbi:MAG TPA: STY0301 family protein [Janthinobacterium sp.]|jgi:hypothetical protein|nr:STY0301 family protein [Janthinobacterium sp.]